MSFRDDLQRAIEPYIKTAPAQAVVHSLLNAVWTVDKVLRGENTAEVRAGASQILLDLTAGLNSNPFWLEPRTANYIMPVFTNAVLSWLHSYQYAKADATPEEKLQFLVARNVLAEVAVAVLYCERGAKGFAEDGARLREAIVRLRI